MSLLRSVRTTLEMIKWEHSVFALPFALAGAFLAARGWPSAYATLWIVVAMISARSAAMAFNRLADASIDSLNPRTSMRAIPAGALSRRFVAVFVVIAAGVFVFAAWKLNRLAFELSPVALCVLLGYSYTKRFTQFSHFILGLALGIAPAAAWIAVRGSIDPRILILTAMVIVWVAGFDVLYACQDFTHDRAHGLFSIPASVGVKGAFWIARGLHLTAFLLLLSLVQVFHLGPIAQAGAVLVGALLLYEHSIVSPRDLTRLNAAFFTMNGVIAIVFLVSIAGDLLIRLHR